MFHPKTVLWHKPSMSIKCIAKLNKKLDLNDKCIVNEEEHQSYKLRPLRSVSELYDLCNAVLTNSN